MTTTTIMQDLCDKCSSSNTICNNCLIIVYGKGHEHIIAAENQSLISTHENLNLEVGGWVRDSNGKLFKVSKDPISGKLCAIEFNGDDDARHVWKVTGGLLGGANEVTPVSNNSSQQDQLITQQIMIQGLTQENVLLKQTIKEGEKMLDSYKKIVNQSQQNTRDAFKNVDILQKENDRLRKELEFLTKKK